MKSIDLKRLGTPSGPLTVLLYVFGMGVIDILLRAGLMGREFLSLPLLYVNSLLFGLFLGVILILWRLVSSQEEISHQLKELLSYYWILSLNPLIVYLFHGDLSGDIISSGLMGILLPVVVISLILGFKNHFKDGVLKFLAFSSSVVILSIPVFSLNRVSLSMGARPQFKLYEFFTFNAFLRSNWTEGLLLNQKYHLLVLLLLVEIFIIYSLLMYRSFYPTFKNIIKTVKPFRTLHFVAMVLLGVVFLRTAAPDEALSLTSINHIPFAVLPALSLTLVWHFTTLFNDRYDMDIDVHVHPGRPLIRDKLGFHLYDETMLTSLFLSFILSLLLGFHVFILNICAVLLAVLYSVPPVRLRDRLFGHVCVGFGSVIAFLSGVYSPSHWYHGISIYSDILERNIPFFPEIFQLSLLIFIVLSISPLINALSDYEGDLKAGVKNVYTVLGLQKGKKLVSVLIVFLFMSPTMWFNSPWDILLMLSTGIISAFIFNKKEDHRPVFALYFLVLLYVLIRLWGY
ncbi:MAG: UbiA family prenyltransferase [Thermoplasmata archaeon]